MRLFVPLWDPPEGVHAGGYYRARRMLEKLTCLDLFVVKNDTFELSVEAISYPTRMLYAKAPGLFEIFRVLNWTWSTLALCVIGLSSRRPIDAVYVPTSEILPTALAGWFVGRMRRVPVVFCNLNVRDTEFWMFNRYLHRQADGIITLSVALANELRSEGITRLIRIGTVGVDDLHVRPSHEPEFECVYVGRHTEAKGIFELLDIWERVVRVKPNAKLLTVGSIGPRVSARIAAILKKRNIESNVTMMGPVAEEVKWRAYANAKICVFPSLVEGWGIVPIEAHLAGVPVIAYDLPAYAQTIASSPAALCVPVADRQRFADTIIGWMDHPPPAGAGRAWAQRFTWAAAAHREECLLEGIVASSK